MAWVGASPETAAGTVPTVVVLIASGIHSAQRTNRVIGAAMERWRLLRYTPTFVGHRRRQKLG